MQIYKCQTCQTVMGTTEQYLAPTRRCPNCGNMIYLKSEDMHDIENPLTCLVTAKEGYMPSFAGISENKRIEEMKKYSSITGMVPIVISFIGLCLITIGLIVLLSDRVMIAQIVCGVGMLFTLIGALMYVMSKISRK